MLESESDDATGEMLRTTMSGLRGTDGASLWSFVLAHAWAYVMTTSDVTGDGKDDVIVFYDGRPPFGSVFCFEICTVEEEAEFIWSLQVISGGTGAVAWTIERTGTMRAQRAGVLGAPVHVEEVTEAAVLPLQSADHDGDGSPDLILNSYDTRITRARTYGAIERLEFAWRASVVSGRSGATLLQRSHGYDTAAEQLSPGGSLTAAPPADLLWQRWDYPEARYKECESGCATTQRTRADYEAIDGATFEAAWHRTVEDVGDIDLWLDAATADLDAAGSDDLLLYARRLDTPHLGAVAGEDGDVLWRHASSYDEIWARDLGIAGGAPGHDLIVVESEWGFSFDEESHSYVYTQDALTPRLDGATGELLLTGPELHYDDRVGGDLLFDFLPDANGDGSLDVGVVSYSPEGTSVSVASGASGDLLTALTRPDALYPWSLGDLDEDGRPEIELGRSDPGRGTVTVEIVGLPHGSTLWSRTDQFGAQGWMFALQGAALDETPGADLLLHRGQYFDSGSGHYETRIDAVTGLAGSQLWGVGDELSPFGPASRGSIRGRTVDTGGSPIAGVCVRATTLGADWWEDPIETTASAAGEFEFRGLEAASYVLRLRDCGGRVYATEWYANAAREDAATPVEVHPGDAIDLGDIAMAVAPPPANDDPATPMTIASLRFTYEGSTEGSTFGPTEPTNCATSRTVWFRLLVDEIAIEGIHVEADFPSVLGLFHGTNEGPLLSDACTPYGSGFEVTGPGTVYWLQVGSRDGEAGLFELVVEPVVD